MTNFFVRKEKLLFKGGIILGLLLDLFSFIAYGVFLKEVTEEKIGRNMEFLKRYEWFQKLLNDDQFKQLIIYNSDVRLVIGKMNRKKMKRNAYHHKFQKKIRKKLINYASV